MKPITFTTRQHRLAMLKKSATTAPGWGFAISILLLSALPVAWGHGSGHTNLKVLSKVSHDALEDGMTDFAKGLGVKCLACHVKNEYASDERPAKVAARKFLATVLHENDPGQRADALKTLLNQMTLPTAKDEARIWKALARRQPSK